MSLAEGRIRMSLSRCRGVWSPRVSGLVVPPQCHPLARIFGTQHSALSTQHSALSTQHSALSTQHSPLTTHHSPLTTQHSALSTQHSALSSVELETSRNLPCVVCHRAVLCCTTIHSAALKFCGCEVHNTRHRSRPLCTRTARQAGSYSEQRKCTHPSIHSQTTLH